MRWLWLIRHADARPGKRGEPDFDRPLSPQGNRDAERFATRLADHPHRPQWVLASSANRARATAIWTIRGAAIGQTSLQFDRRLYDASIETFLEIVRAAPEQIGSLAVVGHNPGISHALSTLTDGQQRFGLVPLGVALLQVAGHWIDLAPGTTTLVSTTQPESETW
jgi:phosphohistidine phosphatase